MRYFLFVVLILITNLSNAQSNNVYIGGLKDDSGPGAVDEIGSIEQLSPHVLSQASLMRFKHNSDDYYGVNFSASFSVGHKLKAYSGLGGFVARLEDCAYDPKTNKETNEKTYEKTCTEDYTIGLYPEVGVLLSILKVSVGIYGRYYKTYDDEANEYRMMGFRLAYEL